MLSAQDLVNQSPVEQLTMLSQQTPAFVTQEDVESLEVQNLGIIQSIFDHFSGYYSSDDFEFLSAKKKMKKMWRELSKNQKSHHYHGAVETSKIVLYDVTKTFQHRGDELPRDPFGERKKLIHSVGVVGKVKFISDGNHPYTGIFKGADYGIIRLSTMHKPSETQPMVPGFGLKFLRDQQESANIVAMGRRTGWGGQPGNWNFFSRTMSNYIVNPGYTSEQDYVMAEKFEEATKWLQNVGLQDVSRYDQNGKTEKPKEFPFALNFRPHSDVNTLFSNELNTEVKDPYMYHIDQLKSVPKDSTLYEVYALSAPYEAGGVDHKIGTIKLDGELITSNWGDKNLFFRHNDMENDFLYHPEFKKGCPLGF